MSRMKCKLTNKKHLCIQCGDCCQYVVCGYAMERRGWNENESGPCEFLRSFYGGKLKCGIYVDLIKQGKTVRAGIMARNLHFGKGCTAGRNARRQALLREKISSMTWIPNKGKD